MERQAVQGIPCMDSRNVRVASRKRTKSRGASSGGAAACHLAFPVVGGATRGGLPSPRAGLVHTGCGHHPAEPGRVRGGVIRCDSLSDLNPSTASPWDAATIRPSLGASAAAQSGATPGPT